MSRRARSYRTTANRSLILAIAGTVFLSIAAAGTSAASFSLLDAIRGALGISSPSASALPLGNGPDFINEVLFNPPGADGPNEYVEIRSIPNRTIPAGTYLVGIEGDSGNPGDVQTIFDLSGLTIGSNGYLTIRQMNNTYTVDGASTSIVGTGTGFTGAAGFAADSGTDIENSSASFLLITTSTAPTLTDDIDPDNDGVADGVIYAGWVIRDPGVGVVDAATDSAYSPVVYSTSPTFVGSAGRDVVVTTTAMGYVGRQGTAQGNSSASDWYAGALGGTAPNWTMNAGDSYPAGYGGQALNHIGSLNPLPGVATPTPTPPPATPTPSPTPPPASPTPTPPPATPTPTPTPPPATPTPTPTPPPASPTPTPTPPAGCAGQTFPASGLPIAIPDNSPGGVPITITVSGLTGTLTSAQLRDWTWGPAHSWGGDIKMTLQAPSGGPTATIVERRGNTVCPPTGFGSSNDLVGPYNFGDGFPNTFHTVAGNPVPAGDYSASQCVTTPGEAVSLNTIFGGPVRPTADSAGLEVFDGMAPEAANGNWTLTVSDNAGGDTGTLSSANLCLVAGGGGPSPTPPPASPTPSPNPSPSVNPTPSPSPTCVPGAGTPGTWSNGIVGPAARYRHGAVSDGTFVYVFGGGDSVASTRFNDLWRWDPTTGTWTQLANMPTGKQNIQGAYWNGKIYVPGGYNATPAHITENAIYDIATNTWSTGAPEPAAVSGATVAYNNKVYVFGGNPGPTAITRIYDIAANTWSTGASMPTATTYGRAVVVGNFAYYIGGIAGATTAAVHRYDLVADTWSTMAPLQTARASAEVMASPDGTSIFAVMGGDSTFFTGVPLVNSVEIYNIAANSWSYGNPVVTKAAAPAGGLAGGKLMVQGGVDTTTYLNAVQISTLSGGGGCPTPTPPPASPTPTPPPATPTPTPPPATPTPTPPPATPTPTPNPSPSPTCPPGGALQLYAVDSSRALSTIDITTGAKTLIGTVSANAGTTSGMAYDPVNNIVYLSSSGNDSVYTLDLATGTATLIGAFGDAAIVMHGLEYDTSTGILYGVSSHNNGLYNINKTTGVATLIGTSTLTSFTNIGFNSTTNQMFATNSGADSFYSMDRATGATTLIGPLSGPTNPNGLAYNPNNQNLYLVDNTTDSLYTINTATGAATLIGSTGAGNLLGLTFAGTSGGGCPTPSPTVSPTPSPTPPPASPTPTPPPASPTPTPTPGCTPGAGNSYLYALNDDSAGSNIYGFQVDESTGTLTGLAGFPVAAGNGGINSIVSERMTVDNANGRLYVINDSSDTVSAYAINPATGALTAMPFSPIALGTGGWNSITVHPSGSPLVVASNSTNGPVQSFVITPTTATSAAGSPYPMGAAVAGFSSRMSQDGNYYYVGGNLGANIGGFSVDAGTGVLTPIAGAPFPTVAASLGYATDSAGRLYSVDTTNGIRVFTSSAGALSPAAGNPFPSGLSARRMGFVHPNQNFYMVAGNSGNNVGVYQISGSGAATTVAPVAGSPFATGATTANGLVTNAAGTFLFVNNRISRSITTFSVNTGSGALTNLGSQPSNTLGSIGAINGIGYMTFAGGGCPTPTPPPATPTPTPPPATPTPSPGGTPEIRFSANTYYCNESMNGVITLVRNFNTTGTDTVNLATSNGTAVGGAAPGAGIDYQNVNTNVTFLPTEASKNVNVPCYGDTLTEATETVNLTLSGPFTRPGGGDEDEGTTAAAPEVQNAVLNIIDTASAFRFTNPICVTLGGTADAYPAPIPVAGGPASIAGMRVTLYDLSYTFPDHIDALLVGPGGQKFVMMGDAGGALPIPPGSPVTLSFRDIGPGVLPNSGPLVTGNFEPTTWETPVTNFPGAAPAGPYSEPGSTIGGTGTQTFAGNFGGTNANGVWNLWIRDDAGVPLAPEAISGCINGGWGLEFLSTTAANASISGRVLTADGRPIRNVTVSVTGNSLSEPRVVQTGSFGYYNFDDLRTGETYVITVQGRRYFFQMPSQIVSLTDNIADLNFIALPDDSQTQ
ncbi:MAG: beta-propeller fold lactonase family protein [Chloracidobacterium sp.]|nr:beta-propeller fold lactonase family protein [Chloracidobacterium sp.]